MQPGRVLGNATATIKHDSFIGQRLIIVQPMMRNLLPDGPPLLALDELGCRPGDQVMLTSDGLAVRDLTGTEQCPARWSVCGLIDQPGI